MTIDKTKPGIIWDMDGTILDSCDLYYRTMVQAYEYYGYAELAPTEEYFRTKIFGSSLYSCMKRAMGADYEPVRCAEMAKYFSDLSYETLISGGEDSVRFVPGVKRVLDELYEAGCPMAVASSSNLDWILGAADGLGIRDRFVNILSGQLLPTKPAPDVFRVAADSLAMPYENCVVFEDSLHGMKGAKAARMKCVGISSSVTPEQMIDADIALACYDDLTLDRLWSLWD